MTIIFENLKGGLILESFSYFGSMILPKIVSNYYHDLLLFLSGKVQDSDFAKNCSYFHYNWHVFGGCKNFLRLNPALNIKIS